MGKIKRVSLILTAIILLIISGCKSSDNNKQEIEGYQHSISECRTDSRVSQNAVAPSGKQLLSYRIDSKGNLEMTHINTILNCCPGQVSSEITTQGATIQIDEKEEQAGCKCLCNYDITFRLINVKKDTYKVAIRNYYLHPITFTINLKEKDQGTVEAD